MLVALGLWGHPVYDLGQPLVRHRIVLVERLDGARDPAVWPDDDHSSTVEHVVVPQTTPERRIGRAVVPRIAREEKGEVLLVEPGSQLLRGVMGNDF